MAKVLVEETNLQNIANSIRNKNGESTTYLPSEMATAIDNIPTGVEDGTVFNVTFNMPTGAVLILKDSNNNVVTGTGNVYALQAGTYTYSATCNGYYNLTNKSFTLNANSTITINSDDTYVKTSQNIGVEVNVTINVGLIKILYLTFVITPSNATLVLKNSGGTTLSPESGRRFKLQAGTYSYTLTASGYKKSTGTVTLTTADKTETVVMEEQSYEIVPFATATDEQIRLLLEAHYDGQIDLSTIWSVGDVRKVHINAMSAGAGSTRAHVAQDMQMVIIGFNHDDLATAIGSKTKSAVTIQCKETLGNSGTQEDAYLSGDSSGSSYENPSYWNNANRRTWLNTTFVGALPSTFRSLIKTVTKGNLNGHNTTNVVNTQDKAFFLSYPEIFGSETYLYYRGGNTPGNYEGTQYPYYATANNRHKYANNNGSASSNGDYYWLRSPSSSYDNFWCGVSSGSAGYNYYDGELGVAPAFAI